MWFSELETLMSGALRRRTFTRTVTFTAPRFLSSTEPQVVKQLASSTIGRASLRGSRNPVLVPMTTNGEKLNRETNYLQAVQLRAIVDRVIGHHEGGPGPFPASF